MSTVFAKNVNWRFAQAKKLDFVEKVKSGANFLTLIDIGVKSTIIYNKEYNRFDFGKLYRRQKS
mgnify:CR=1 FL=1